MEDQLLELDSRGRASFAQILGKSSAGRRYLVRHNDDGTIILTPAVVISTLEARFLANPTVLDQIEKNRADLSQTVSRADRKPAAKS